MDKTSINELNALLKGEHMAIDGYERYIQKVTQPNVKGELQKIQQDHKQHAIKIAERIQQLGGVPGDGVGIAGKAAEIMTSLRDIGNKDPKHILKEAYNGENNGIKMADEVVKGDLDNDSRNLVNGILNADRSHLDSLNNLMNSLGGLQ